jgi:hypothetical protein
MGRLARIEYPGALYHVASRWRKFEGFSRTGKWGGKLSNGSGCGNFLSTSAILAAVASVLESSERTIPFLKKTYSGPRAEKSTL